MNESAGKESKKSAATAKSRAKEGLTPAASNCESCVFFEYDEDADDDICTLDLDEDDLGRYLAGHTDACPYYRYYDEYKSVRNQN